MYADSVGHNFADLYYSHHLASRSQLCECEHCGQYQYHQATVYPCSHLPPVDSYRFEHNQLSYGHPPQRYPMMRSRASSSYYQSDYGHTSYPAYSQHSHGYGSMSTHPVSQQPSPAQHNHPPYYPTGPQSSPYDQHREQPMYERSSYANGYPPGMSGSSGARYGADQSMDVQYGNSYPYAEQTQSYQQPVPQPPPVCHAPPKSSYPAPTTLNLKSSTSKNPYGQTGPYGIDANNQYMDYYRKLYYPYDPITGEYMKDTPPPDNTTSLLPNASGMGSDQQHLMQHMQRQHPNHSSRYPGSGMDGANMMAMSSNYYANFDNENDSLLLCCDFLIPRPSINCLIITLFAMLVLIIIFTVVKFTIIFPSDSSNEETLALVDQIVVLLLFAALIALIWIFGIYFTSRRTRRQIANLLSCAGNPATVETTLAPDYNGLVYANSSSNASHQHHHAHHHSGRVPRASTTYANYRYANNFV